MKCKDCRFCNQTKCLKFNIIVNEDYKACNDYAEKSKLNESVKAKIKLYD